jgi:hypothetical protein
MVNVSLGKKRYEKIFAAIIIAASIFLSPGSAFASTILPSQVIPPATGRSCGQITFSDIKAYVYNGYLDSFDITISDRNYVAVYTEVDKSPIGYNYITRWSNADGSLKIHVDLQPTQFNRDISVQMAFLGVYRSENGSQVTCMFNVPATIHFSGSQSSEGGGGAHVVQPDTVIGGTGETPVGAQTTSTVATSSNNAALVGAISSIGNLCADGGASKLWVVLLILFSLFCITLCTQRFETGSSVRDWNIGLILSVFVGLLVFWYVSATCRAGSWAPALATLITIAGLLYSMLKSDDTQEILLLKDGKK